jgi:protein SCO1
MINRRQLFAGIALSPLAGAVAGCGRMKGERSKAPGRRQFAPPLSGREMLRRRSFPNVTLVSSAGKEYKFYDDLLKDKIVVLNFMYADCQGICPTIATNLKRVRKILDAEVTRDVFIYSLTVKPEVDTPAKLKQFAAMHGINDPRWLFLTGKPEEVDTLRHLLGFSDPNPEIDKDKSKHSGMLRYGNESLSLWGSCQGSGEPDWIAQEIQFAVPRQFRRHPLVNE